MNRFHISTFGEVQYCANPGACASLFGHFPTNEAAVVRRNILAGQGRLYMAGLNGGAGEGGKR